MTANAVLHFADVLHRLVNDPVLADAGGHLKAEILQLRCHQGGRFGFLEGQLRIGVELFVDFDQFRVGLGHCGIHCCGGCRRGVAICRGAGF